MVANPVDHIIVCEAVTCTWFVYWRCGKGMYILIDYDGDEQTTTCKSYKHKEVIK